MDKRRVSIVDGTNSGEVWASKATADDVVLQLARHGLRVNGPDRVGGRDDWLVTARTQSGRRLSAGQLRAFLHGWYDVR